MAKKTAAKTTKPAKASTKTAKSTPAKKTTTKAAAKTAVKPQKSHDEKPSVAAAEERKSPGFRIKKSYLLIALGTVLFIAFLWTFKSLFVAGVVNGQPISRLAVVKETEKQAGRQAFETLKRNVLIEQEAKKRNVTVSEKEINDEIKKLETNVSQQGQKLDDVLKQQGMNRDDLKKLIRLDKLVGKMVGQDIKITDQQVNDYIEKNKDVLPQNQNEAQLKTDVRERLRQQELSQKVQTWLQDIESKARIQQYVSY